MLLNLLWLAVPAYIIVQVFVLLRKSGSDRLVAGLPLIVMLPVLVMTIVGLIQNQSLWPLMLLFISPVALLFVCLVAFANRHSKIIASTANDTRPATTVTKV